jgi:hypothetical protein
MRLLGSNFVYPKFEKIGDSVSGEFVSYEECVASKFGDENILTLRNNGDKIVIRCKANLSRKFHGAMEQGLVCPGNRVTITFTGTMPSNKGNPTKLFDVEVEE